MDCRRLELAEWQVSEADGTLRRDGEELRLEPKVMQVLLTLAAHPGQVVPKEDLFAAVWPDTIVEDGVLTQAIHSIRKALGDDARNPRYIETIPRRGYRLIAEVVEGGEGEVGEGLEGGVGEVVVEEEGVGESARMVPRLGRGWGYALAVLVGLVVVGVVGVAWMRAGEEGRRGEADLMSTAEETEARNLRRMLVPPVIVEAAPGTPTAVVEEARWRAAGVLDDLVGRLSRSPELTVVVMPQDGRYERDRRSALEVDLDAAEADLYMEMIVWCSAREQPELILQLGRKGLAKPIWEARWPSLNGTWKPVSRKSFDQLTSVLMPAREARSESAPLTDNGEAYLSYILGLGQKRERSHKAEGRDRALASFREAVRIDPDFAAAHAQIVEILVRSYLNDRSQDKLAEAFNALLEAQKAERRLIEQGKTGGPLPSVQLAVASYNYGLADYDKAIERNLEVAALLPGSPEPWKGAAYAARRKGDLRMAVQYFEEARRRQPGDFLMLGEMAETYQALGEHEEAKGLFDMALWRAASLRLTGGGSLEDECHYMGERAMNAMEWGRTVEAARESLAEAESFLPPQLFQKRVDQVERCTDGASEIDTFRRYQVEIDLMMGQPQRALDRIKAMHHECLDSTGRLRLFWREALAYREAGQHSAARAVAEAALPLLQERVDSAPQMAFYHAHLGLALAFLDRPQEAREEGLRAVELDRHDHYSGPRSRWMLAAIYSVLGKADPALEELKSLMEQPYQHRALKSQLLYHPLWNSVRNHPEFTSLLD